jgi:pimeloyl-ACP methyl ester carboxylesterase
MFTALRDCGDRLRGRYGTVKQVDAVVTRVKGPAESLLLQHCGHSPHSERPDEVLEAAARFVPKTLDLAGQVI